MDKPERGNPVAGKSSGFPNKNKTLDKIEQGTIKEPVHFLFIFVRRMKLWNLN